MEIAERALVDIGVKMHALPQLHSKIVAIDGEQLCIGSYNWLSADRQGKYARHETSFFVGGQSEELRGHIAFRDCSYDLDEVSLNEASIERLLDWCGGDQEKLTKLAGLVCPFTTVEGGGAPLENPKKVKLSDHMTSLLDAVDDRASVVEAIFARTWPSGWSGSLADILEVRARALEELSEYPSAIVQEMVVEKLKEISRAVLRNRASEAEENNRQEQRFE